MRGDLGRAVQQFKREPGNGLFVGGVKLALALVTLGLIDEYEFVVHPGWQAHRPGVVRGAIEACQAAPILKGATAINYQPSARLLLRGVDTLHSVESETFDNAILSPS